MKKMVILLSSVFLLGIGSMGTFGADQTEKMKIVTYTSFPYFQGFDFWEFNSEKKIYQRTLSDFLNLYSKDYYDKFEKKGLLSYGVGLPLILDIDGDGENEFVAIDEFGIIVCGQSPQYFPFEKSSNSDLQVLVEDLDNDGIKEFITQRSSFPVKDGDVDTRIIQIWKINDNKLIEVWNQSFSGTSFCLLYEDSDNDGEKELITVSDTITIMKKKSISDWYITAELPNIGQPYNEFTLIDVVRVADVDNDGKNEILATGNSGMLTVYKHRKQPQTGNESYPVMWQSPPLVSRDGELASKPHALTQGLGIGDVDNDGQNEILVGTLERGNFPSRKSRYGGKIHIFKYKGNRTFQTQWISDWTTGAGIPGIAIGDVDGDQINEFVYDGWEVYKYNDQDSSYQKTGELDIDAQTGKAVIGHLPYLNEPVTSQRIIPVRCDMLSSAIKPGQTYKTSISFKNEWAETKNVKIDLKTDSSYLQIENGNQKLGLMKTGEIIDSQPISIRIEEIKNNNEEGYIILVFWVEITADGGYKQLVPISIFIWLEGQNSF